MLSFALLLLQQIPRAVSHTTFCSSQTKDGEFIVDYKKPGVFFDGVATQLPKEIKLNYKADKEDCGRLKPNNEQWKWDNEDCDKERIPLCEVPAGK